MLLGRGSGYKGWGVSDAWKALRTFSSMPVIVARGVTVVSGWGLGGVRVVGEDRQRLRLVCLG